MTFKQVRVWPLAERSAHSDGPLIHLIQDDEEVLGLTLCGQSARNAMTETPAADLVGLKKCEVCDSISVRREART